MDASKNNAKSISCTDSGDHADNIDTETGPVKRLKIFTTGDALRGFGIEFLDEDVCRYWILKEIHNAEIKCPGCKTILKYFHPHPFWQGKRVRCSKCGKFFTALTGTFISGSHMDFREIMLLAVFLEAGLSNKQIADILKCTDETVRLWRLKFEANAP